jgi:hypothetical protein
MAKGKWAQGITPRGFLWIIEGQLAICERPGGYGTNHRRVRRQEEVIWIRENGFSFVVSLIPSDHNLHSYDEQGMPWRHWPFSPTLDLELALPQIYTEIDNLLAADKKLLLHIEEVGDRIGGLMAGYVLWTRKVPVPFDAIMVIEQIMSRQLDPSGRQIVTATESAMKRIASGEDLLSMARAAEREAEGGDPADPNAEAGRPDLKVVDDPAA